MAVNCLFDCLKEAHLEVFHNNFLKRGVTRCEAIASLSMQDYCKFGVVSMEDRLRLFKLIQIIKTVQASGHICKHEAEAESAVVHLAANDESQKLKQKKHWMGSYESHRVSSREPDKSDSVPEKEVKSDFIGFKTGSGSPVFKCRKTLLFVDSGSETDEEDGYDRNADKKESSNQRNESSEKLMPLTTFFVPIKKKAVFETKHISEVSSAMDIPDTADKSHVVNEEMHVNSGEISHGNARSEFGVKKVCTGRAGTEFLPKKETEHAYFPLMEATRSELHHVQTVYHSKDMDILCSDDQLELLPSRPSSRTRIKVFVRKRPILKHEYQRKEFNYTDIVACNREDATVTVQISKVAFDLSKYIQKVRINYLIITLG